MAFRNSLIAPACVAYCGVLYLAFASDRSHEQDFWKEMFDKVTAFMEDGLCKDSNPDDFFDGFEKSPREAKEKFINMFCGQCPVAQKCFSYGKVTKQYGLWGGVYLENGRPARNTLGKQHREAERDQEAKIKVSRLQADKETVRLSQAS